MTIQRACAVAAAALLFVAVSCSSSKPKVGIIGDSITQFADKPLHQALDPSYDVELVGQFGRRADELLPFATVIAKSKPSQAIINLGTNDATEKWPVEGTRAALDQMVKMLAGAKCIHLVEVNEGITDNGAARTAEAHAINEQLRQIAKSNPSVSVIPWNRDIAANGGNGQITYDGKHLSSKGFVVLAATYRRALSSC